MSNARQAFVLRIAPSEVDRVMEALANDQIIIGWSEAAELLDPSLDWVRFRETLRSHYYANEANLRKAGSAGGHMWRFVREMKPGDLVVVPYGSSFYVAEVSGAATHDPARVADDTAFRRQVRWLNGKQPIPRALARAPLQSRMKTQGTCAYATDLIDEIDECLALARQGKQPTFQSDLHQRLVRDTLDEIRSGRMNDFGFEHLLKSVLEGLGAQDVRIVPRLQDKGADLLATFLLAGAFRLLVAVQAKHFQPSAGGT
jgi:predicted Mrr-cat superfamily restriction endonuclease